MATPSRHFVPISGARGSLTLPADVRRRFGLDEPGAQVEVVTREDDGVIELHPVLPHRADQAWFWTERWQAGEREVDEHVAAGRTRVSDDIEAMFEDIDANQRP